MSSERILVIGGPRCGKTTHAARLELPVFHTDDLKDLEWSEASTFIVDNWFSQPGPWVIEGVAAIRALRRWVKSRPGLPCDRLLAMWTPVVELTPGQKRMFKACRTIWAEIADEVIGREARR